MTSHAGADGRHQQFWRQRREAFLTYLYCLHPQHGTPGLLRRFPAWQRLPGGGDSLTTVMLSHHRFGRLGSLETFACLHMGAEPQHRNLVHTRSTQKRVVLGVPQQQGHNTHMTRNSQKKWEAIQTCRLHKHTPSHSPSLMHLPSKSTKIR